MLLAMGPWKVEETDPATSKSRPMMENGLWMAYSRTVENELVVGNNNRGVNADEIQIQAGWFASNSHALIGDHTRHYQPHDSVIKRTLIRRDVLLNQGKI